MMDATDVGMSDEEIFLITDISAFSANLYGILSVSQCTCIQNQCIFFVSCYTTSSQQYPY